MNRFVKSTLAIALAPCLLTLSFTSFAATPANANTQASAPANAMVAAPAPASASNVTVSPEEKAKIQQVVHEYLVQKPEVIVESMQVLQSRQAQEADKTIKNTQQTAAQYASGLFHQTSDPVIGNPNGKVTVVEFFDYQCGHCINMAPVMADIIKANPNVRIIFKDFPIRGPVSEFAARAALAAKKQGKYYELSHALLTAPQPLTQEAIIEIAKKLGLNVAQLQTDMKDASIDKQLKETMQLAQSLKLLGTPAFFIGKSDVNPNGSISYVPGQMDKTQLQTAIDQAGK